MSIKVKMDIGEAGERKMMQKVLIGVVLKNVSIGTKFKKPM